MIVATAGHIDHGKTLLVKALTGIDTDRLPEEKRRGISIDLGYAYHPLADGEILGFVDVPGHEKFIHNMLAGVTGIDCALLVVAADDGPMPQTIEHLTILDLLGLENGVVALTKIDRVDADRVHEVAETVQSLLDATGLAGAPVLPVSGITGEGVDAVREHLVAAARRGRAEAAKGYFRLAIDRTFTIKGAGLVVTGTIFSGAVHPDDRLVISPRGMMVRVRGVHAQNREAKEAHPGQRSALNIAGQGLSKDLIHRGDWVVAEPIHAPTARIDGRIKLLPSEERPLKHWTPVHLHLGAADVTARLAILEGRAIEPGASALVQIVLDTPIGALSGDRFILRDQSAWRTIGGGVVIDPFPPRRGRSRPQRLATLAAMERDDRAEALAGMLEQSPAGLDLDRLARSWNLMPGEAGALWAKALSAGAPMVVLGAGAAGTGLSQARWQTLRQAILAALADWHRSSPDQIGASENALRLALSEPVPPNLFKAIVSDLAPRRGIDGKRKAAAASSTPNGDGAQGRGTVGAPQADPRPRRMATPGGPQNRRDAGDRARGAHEFPAPRQRPGIGKGGRRKPFSPTRRGRRVGPNRRRACGRGRGRPTYRRRVPRSGPASAATSPSRFWNSSTKPD